MRNKQLKVLEPNDIVKEELKKLYVVLAGLQVVKLILWFVDTFVSKVSVEQVGYEYSQSHSFHSVYEGAPTINTIIMAVSVISIIICVFAVFKKCVEKSLFAKILKPIMIISCVHYLFYVCLSVAEVISNGENFASSYGQGAAEMYSGPNFWGIIQFVVIAISTIITFKISLKTKAIANWKKEQVNSITL